MFRFVLDNYWVVEVEIDWVEILCFESRYCVMGKFVWGMWIYWSLCFISRSWLSRDILVIENLWDMWVYLRYFMFVEGDGVERGVRFIILEIYIGFDG